MRAANHWLPAFAFAMIFGLAACHHAGKPAAFEPPPGLRQPLPGMIAGQLCDNPAPCGDDCSNVPYVKNTCWTTVHGPAAANIVISADDNPQHSTNMLLCASGPYALCFFSGPPDATGKSSDNQKLPCTIEPGGDTADCACQYYGSGISYVDMNGIINQNAYYQTVQACGHDGALCANMKECTAIGEPAGTSSCAQEAPVCAYVRNQNAQAPEQSLVPGYDTISTFSLAMLADYKMAPTTNCKIGKYVGCMTAPCRFPEGVTDPEDTSIVQCECPVAEGPFQIGQSGVDCDIPNGSDGTRYLWSAARTVKHGNPKQNHGGG